MKSYLSLFVLMLAPFIALAQTQPDWVRYPSLSPDGTTIVFTYMGDLYRIPASGGEARQLTFHEAHDFMPVWSNDGTKIAFASNRYGNFDVFVMEAAGGPAVRLTWHSNDEHPYSFSHDDQHVIFGGVRQDLAEHRQFPTGSMSELYQVPVRGGRIAQLFSIPAELVQVSRDGSRMVYQDKKGGENEWRKHHISAIARDIWLYEPATNRHTMLTTFGGEDRQPVFSADQQSLFYLSAENGTFNVHRMRLPQAGTTPGQSPSPQQGNTPQSAATTTTAPVAPSEQITHFETHPVRFLSQGGGTLAFTWHGELYTMRENGEPTRVPFTIRTQAGSNTDKFISINGGVSEMAISPNGKEIAFIARGEVFVTSVDGAMTKRITNTPETERFVTFTPDGNAVMYASERDGRWSIFQTERVRSEEPFFFASTLLRERAVVTADVDAYQPQVSPDGRKLAYISDRRNLVVRDLASGAETRLLDGEDLIHMRDGDQYLTWSPDSRWLLFDWRKRLSISEVLLIAADGSRRVNLTESGYSDSGARWVNEGKQMIWFTDRDGLRSYASSGRTETDVYSMFFTQEAWDTFNLTEDELKLRKAVEAALKKDETPAATPSAGNRRGAAAAAASGATPAADATPALTFDWTGLTDRRARLTIHSSALSDAVLSKDGEKLYYLARFEQNYNLWETNLRTRETKMTARLNTGPGSLFWDKDMENLYLLSRGSISKLNLTAGSSSSIRIAGEMTYDAALERAHMFDHVYNRTRNLYYEPTFHGIDWDFMYEAYKPKLAHVGNSYEFAELLAEMLGELNVSHSGARYNDSIDNPDETASLGIFMDYAHTGNGIRIAEVIQGGPLDKAGSGIVAGMVIESIDGVAITPDRDVASFLNRKAGQFVMLELVGSGRGERKQFVAKPITLGEERALLYRRYIRLNEAEVSEKSGGRLGYVHIPGMGDGPFRSVLQDMLGKYFDREAIVVDTRFNGGGDLVADLVMFFTGVQFNTYATADRDFDAEPTRRWTKPTISLYNESMYSDGHCYAAAYSELELGLSVGMPVPGTCSFASWETLPDGTRWGVVPISARNFHGEWMENNETSPTILVKNMPGFIDRGVDQQLERAIQEMLRQLDENR